MATDTRGLATTADELAAEEESGLPDAAYEDAVYADSTDDGIDSEAPEELGSQSETATELAENRIG